LLHFGGVDYEAEVYVDGQLAGRHYGGTVSFQVDITRFVRAGATHNLVVHVRDLVRSGLQPLGKQSNQYGSAGCHYTRTTGIWQTVWLEAVDGRGLADIQIVPDLDGRRFVLTPSFHSLGRGNSLRVQVMDGGRCVAETQAAAADGVPIAVDVPDVKKWSPATPFLYDMTLEVIDSDGAVLDSVSSYAGMRKISVEGNRVLLNDEPVYLRLVLDQGFYPDGIWTAPSDEALRRDIELSQQAGFNGARLHQKVFEERFHYWADKLGYLTWGESASWGCDTENGAAIRNFLTEWRQIVVRDRNHPSIIAWSPFNETHPRRRELHDRTIIDAYELTRTLDPTRPINDTSGYHHQRTDLWTVHTYNQDPSKLTETLRPTDGAVFRNYPDKECAYEGQPYIVDEFGGIKWIPEDRRPFADNSWGYGNAPKTEEEFYTRLAGLVQAILGQKHICGYCYTQLTDVEQEQNGVYNYDRSAKFDMARVREIFGATPGA
ncbi:MAG: beta-glucuronidase, partial [Chitinivibrionales bacterium]|nr:beta-glucuronidase [Chitinivibrionales bacterium]